MKRKIGRLCVILALALLVNGLSASVVMADVSGQSSERKIITAGRSLDQSEESVTSLPESHSSQAVLSLSQYRGSGASLPDLHPKHDLHRYRVDQLPAVEGRFSLREATYQLSSQWSSSGSDYYFSQLSTAEKQLYLALKQAADAYLTGRDDFGTLKVQKEKVYVLPLASYEKLEGDGAAQRLEAATKVVDCFIFENPQYYFVRNVFIYDSKSLALQLYDKFANGKKRQEYTKEFQDQILEWEASIDPDADLLTKEKLFHQIVCDNVTYDESAAEDEKNDGRMSQSAVSAVLFGRKTVCAGYSQLFSLLCNRAGIQCLSVTSQEHEWNKVRLGGIWYNVDCTWDDMDPGYELTFFNVTDSFIKKQDSKYKEHVLEKKWASLVKPCTEAFEPSLVGDEDKANITVPKRPKSLRVESGEPGRISVKLPAGEIADGYAVCYGSEPEMKEDQSREIDVGEKACIIKGLDRGKLYFVKIRAYVLDSTGAKLYGDYSAKRKVRVR